MKVWMEQHIRVRNSITYIKPITFNDGTTANKIETKLVEIKNKEKRLQGLIKKFGVPKERMCGTRA